MAIYRIFPEKDAFISSENRNSNTGLDEILEIGSYKDATGTNRVLRSLIKFSNSDIENTISSIIGSTNFSSSLKLSLARASEIPTTFSIEAYPITGSWDEGVGKLGDIPIDLSGVNWVYKKASLIEEWEYLPINTDWVLSSGIFNDSGSWYDSSFWVDTPEQAFDKTLALNTTASFIDNQEGGGTWITSYNSTLFNFSQSFSSSKNLDLDIDLTTAIKLINDNSLKNEGFLLKLNKELEFKDNLNIRLYYFSKDTHTIYPPYLEFKWDDSSYLTGSLSILDTTSFKFNIKNNKGIYTDSGKYRFRLSTRPQYPTRTFSTESIYITNYALPKNSYWGLQDYNTREMIVDFDTQFTKISCDENGPYFDLYMDGLQPERYYKILIKTSVNESTFVIDDDNIFKIEYNG